MDPVVILTASSIESFRGLCSLLVSIYNTSSLTCKRRLRIYVHVSSPYMGLFHHQMGKMKASLGMNIHVVDSSSLYRGHIIVHGARQRLSDISNFVRFSAPDEYVNTKKALYIDDDVVVQKEICTLFDAYLVDGSRHSLAAVPRQGRIIAWQFRHLATKASRYEVQSRMPSLASFWHRNQYNLSNVVCFNAGVMLYRLDMWRKYETRAYIDSLIELNNQLRLWDVGSNGPLCALYANYFERIDGRWNVIQPDNGPGRLGTGQANISLRNAFIIHWNGRRKPWNTIVNGNNIWLSIARHGRCLCSL